MSDWYRVDYVLFFKEKDVFERKEILHSAEFIYDGKNDNNFENKLLEKCWKEITKSIDNVNLSCELIKIEIKKIYKLIYVNECEFFTYKVNYI